MRFTAVQARLFGFGSTLLILGILWWLAGRQMPMIIWGSIFVCSVLVGWATGKWLVQQPTDPETGLFDLKKRLDLALRLNRVLVDATDEKTLIDHALGILVELLGASGGSFIPLDELVQPLAMFSQAEGIQPDQPADNPIMKLLTNESVRQRCSTCKEFEAQPGCICPLMNGFGIQSLHLYCLPVRRGKESLGIFNLYFSGPKVISQSLRLFLESLLDEIALAVHTIRLHNQEWSTMRELQMSRASQVDLPTRMGSLLESLQNLLEARYIILEVVPFREWQKQVQIMRGELEWEEQQAVNSLRQQVLGKGQPVTQEINGENGIACLVMAVPLLVEDGQTVGMLSAVSQKLDGKDRQLALLTNMASQAARLIESQRLLLSLEYQAVIQERGRLAREIHDGLAQTLAYLKLQAAQMQSLHNQGEYDRLGSVIKQSYLALADAYQDTRQAIDHLRINPQLGLQQWLEQVVAEFEAVSGLKVERLFDIITQEPPPEIQAQLVRIIQESLNNVRKHAMAKQVSLTVREWEGDLVLEVGDDGQGFAPEDVPEGSRYGLRGMRERAEWLGADFQIVSQPGRGTVVRLRLPHMQMEELS